MGIYKAQHVPLIPQPTDAVCWYVTARMLYKWSQATGNTGMKNPAEYESTKYRFDNNMDWDTSQVGLLASWLNMYPIDVSLDYNGVVSVLSMDGPIWTAGYKTWAGSYGHVVAIVGAADTGVLIHDPMPLKVGTQKWLTWSQIKKFVSGENCDYSFLVAA